MELVCITIDCANPKQQAEFWSAALGWGAPRVSSDGGGATCRPASDCGTSPGCGTSPSCLEFVRVPEPKSTKNRLHLGCHVGPIDNYDDELERLLALGARLGWKEVFPPGVEEHYRNWILLDPEGNEFCLGGGAWPSGVAMPSEVPVISA